MSKEEGGGGANGDGGICFDIDLQARLTFATFLVARIRILSADKFTAVRTPRGLEREEGERGERVRTVLREVKEKR